MNNERCQVRPVPCDIALKELVRGKPSELMPLHSTPAENVGTPVSLWGGDPSCHHRCCDQGIRGCLAIASQRLKPSKIEYDDSEQHHDEQATRDNNCSEHSISHHIFLDGRRLLSTAESACMPSFPDTVVSRYSI